MNQEHDRVGDGLALVPISFMCSRFFFANTIQKVQ